MAYMARSLLLKCASHEHSHEMANDEIDLYGDLDDYDLAEQLKKTEKKCSDLQERLRECEDRNTIKDTEFQILNKDFRNMNANMHSLFQTAKTEIQRKDNQIRDLRKELDNVRFRRDRRLKNEKNAQLRHIATQTDVVNESKILQENQTKIEGMLKKDTERTKQLNENGMNSIRNPFSSNGNEISNANGIVHNGDLKDKNSSHLSKEKDGHNRRWETNDTHRSSRQKHQKTVDRQNFKRKKRHRSRSISRDRKRFRRSVSKQTDRSTNRFAEGLSPGKNANKETHRTGVRRSDFKRRSPESTPRGDLRYKTQRRLRKSEERHSERSKHKPKNEIVNRRGRHLPDTDKKMPQVKVKEMPTLRAYTQVSNGFESEETKVENCITPQADEAKKYENLEDGEIMDENSTEASPAELIANEKVGTAEHSISDAKPIEIKKTANERKTPLEIDIPQNSEIDVNYKPERDLMNHNKSKEKRLSTAKSNSDLEVEISEVNCMQPIPLENVSKQFKTDLPINTENLHTTEPQVDKMQNVPDGCTSPDKNDEVPVNAALNTSGLLDTPKVVKNISTSSTDYTLVEDDENNDVIIYVSRKKRKKKKSLGKSVAQ